MTMAEIMPYFNISIHALRKESDRAYRYPSYRLRLFQSTLSVRRATRAHIIKVRQVRYFNPRSP